MSSDISSGQSSDDGSGVVDEKHANEIVSEVRHLPVIMKPSAVKTQTSLRAPSGLSLLNYSEGDNSGPIGRRHGYSWNGDHLSLGGWRNASANAMRSTPYG